MLFALSNLYMNNISNNMVSSIKQLVDYMLSFMALKMLKIKLMN